MLLVNQQNKVINDSSPIALFCFKRLDTLKRCVESLRNCPEAIHSDLFIFSDAGSNEIQNQKVGEVRAFLDSLTGFKSINIVYRSSNLGVDYNIIQGIQEMAEMHEKFIIIEDDLVVSKQFLGFMNAGLKHFETFENVLTLSAFNCIQIPKKYIWDCYFAQRTNPWGWGTWSHKIKDVDWDLAKKNHLLLNRAEMKAFDVWGSDRSRMLKRTIKGEIRAWDIRLDYYQFKKNMLTAYSTKNMVENIGFNDLEASNTNGYNRYKSGLDYFNTLHFHFSDLLIFNPKIKKRFIAKNSFFARCKTWLYKLIKYKNI